MGEEGLRRMGAYTVWHALSREMRWVTVYLKWVVDVHAGVCVQHSVAEKVGYLERNHLILEIDIPNAL